MFFLCRDTFDIHVHNMSIASPALSAFSARHTFKFFQFLRSSSSFQRNPPGCISTFTYQCSYTINIQSLKPQFQHERFISLQRYRTRIRDRSEFNYRGPTQMRNELCYYHSLTGTIHNKLQAFSHVQIVIIFKIMEDSISNHCVYNVT